MRLMSLKEEEIRQIRVVLGEDFFLWFSHTFFRISPYKPRTSYVESRLERKKEVVFP